MSLASQTGPYTEDFAKVLPVLDPDAVRRSLVRMMLDAFGRIKQVMSRSSVSVDELTLGMIARAMWGRPNVDPGGPSYVSLLPVLLDTDTKSNADIIKINAHLEEHCSEHSAHAQMSAEDMSTRNLTSDPFVDKIRATHFFRKEARMKILRLISQLHT